MSHDLPVYPAPDSVWETIFICFISLSQQKITHIDMYVCMYVCSNLEGF